MSASVAKYSVDIYIHIVLDFLCLQPYLDRVVRSSRAPPSLCQVMYLALGSVHPTTLAVGNTMKRVFIVVASLIVFKTPMTGMGMVGSAIGIGGVLVYSLTKQHFDALEREEASQSSNDYYKDGRKQG